MIASLPMNDRPETRAANDRLWADIRNQLGQNGIDAPNDLSRDGDLWAHWESTDLVLSQTCGLPYRTRLRDQVHIIASPDYGLADCPPGYYASKIIVHRDDTATDPSDWRRKTLAFNETRSQSGWAAALNHARALNTGFAHAIETGSHIASARAIATKQADIAVIDAQSWRLISRWEGCVDRIQVIGQTSATPATPFITTRCHDAQTVQLIRAALITAVANLSPTDRDLIGLRGLAHLPEDAYLNVPTPKQSEIVNSGAALVDQPT